MQIELLKRYRAGDTDENVVTGIHLTINGVAAGLRNSGKERCAKAVMAAYCTRLSGSGNRLYTTIHTQPKMPLAGLDAAIYVLLGFSDLGGQNVDARNESGQGALTVASRVAPLDPTLFQYLNRTACLLHS
jgi:hypothetical protein